MKLHVEDVNELVLFENEDIQINPKSIFDKTGIIIYILYHSNLESKINTWKESKSRTFSNEIISSKKLHTGTNAKQANFYALRPKIKQLEIDHEFTTQPVSFLFLW